MQIMIKFRKFHYSVGVGSDQNFNCKNEYFELIVTIISVQKDSYVCIKINMLRERKGILMVISALQSNQANTCD